MHQRHSSRNFALKLSSVPFCHGLPDRSGRCRWGPSVTIHFRITLRAKKPGPLSERMKAGAPGGAHETREDVDHPARADAANDLDGEALSCPLVDDREAELLAVGAGVEDTKSYAQT